MKVDSKYLQLVGIVLTILGIVLIAWLYWTEPKNLREAATKSAVTIGTYEIDKAKFDEGLRLFRDNRFGESRQFFLPADSEKRDAKTQFYVAYSFYREGFGKIYSDDKLFKQGIEAVNLVIASDPNFKSDDDNLQMKTSAELKSELEEGTKKTLDDLNPLKILRERK